MNLIPEKNLTISASLILGLLLVIAPYRASGQPGPVESPLNIECLERLEVPNYPPLARQARIQVIQTVKVLLSEQAIVQTVASSLQNNSRVLDLTKKDFTESAEKAIKISRFSKTCGGKTITLVFHSELRDDDSTRSLFAFEPPNHFWIRAGPFLAMPEVSAK